MWRRFERWNRQTSDCFPKEGTAIYKILAYAGSELTQDQTTGSFALVQPRGPDYSTIAQVGASMVGFHRLAIMDPTPAGNQPFILMVPHSSATARYTIMRHSLKNTDSH